MASNFRINLRKNCATVHIRLKGDFDGDSAARLANMIEDLSGEMKKIRIDTCNLDKIHPFGKAVFHARLGKTIRLADDCKIIGENADQFKI
ncbi:hypothetical protein [Desulfatiglans anilini]|uniref:hypothetical protein n=1 Tax=Desulfatiglans anilini TaxID=90728 RepID=UPI0004876832|nr:hypothetical protein [Desulfatiglans anilini]